jgi:carbohydrate kinase (thermoresistant glucokinase family)
MGVSGCGKTRIGSDLARALGLPFIDADDLHDPAARAKMARGEALTDEDRAPWLGRVGAALAAEESAVAACSALRRRYRDVIRRAAGEDVLFIHLSGQRDVIATRLAARQGHFMPPGLLGSQFDTLEPPDADEPHLTLDVRNVPEAIVKEAVRAIRTDQPRYSRDVPFEKR